VAAAPRRHHRVTVTVSSSYGYRGLSVALMMSKLFSARFAWERQEFDIKSHESCVLLVDQSVSEWKVRISGKTGSAYADGTFYVDIWLRPEYPLKEPVLVFKTRIWHPNVELDTGKALIMKWACTKSLYDVVSSVVSLLESPCLSSFLMRQPADNIWFPRPNSLRLPKN
jgi:ubiquitin-protein ligase